MKRLPWQQGLWAAAALLTAALLGAPAAEKKGAEKGWVSLFNGKDLSGWKTHPKNPGNWSVQEGILIGRGKEVSHLFSERGDYENFRYRIEARINDKGNSGQYFRARFEPGYPHGYEAQINATHPDPVKTGSLYPSFDPKLPPSEREKIIVRDILVPPDVWFTQEVLAQGNHIVIWVNGKKTVDFVDKKNTYTRGHFAIQQHPPAPGSAESIIQVRKIEVLELPSGS
jgi:hypothetical protein